MTGGGVLKKPHLHTPEYTDTAMVRCVTATRWRQEPASVRSVSDWTCLCRYHSDRLAGILTPFRLWISTRTTCFHVYFSCRKNNTTETVLQELFAVQKIFSSVAISNLFCYNTFDNWIGQLIRYNPAVEWSEKLREWVTVMPPFAGRISQIHCSCSHPCLHRCMQTNVTRMTGRLCAFLARYLAMLCSYKAWYVSV